MSDVLIRARCALLDALDALGPLRDAVVLTGAQALYLHTGDAPVAVAAHTVDADIQLDTSVLPGAPLIEDVMTGAGFVPNPTSGQPGAWVSAAGVPVDLMVAAVQAGRTGRSVAIPPHDGRSARSCTGLEGGLVDRAPMLITSLDPAGDRRSHTIAVAGPAALLIAKCHKLGERALDAPHRLRHKDAHDVYRLLVAVSADDLLARLVRILADPLATSVAQQALEYLDDLFARGASAIGSEMAGQAERDVGNPDVVAASVAFLAADLIDAVASARGSSETP